MDGLKKLTGLTVEAGVEVWTGADVATGRVGARGAVRTGAGGAQVGAHLTYIHIARAQRK